MLGLLLNNIKLSEEAMFLNFCIAQGFFIPQTYHLLQPLPSSIPASPAEAPAHNPEDYIDLTKEDHLKAGYDKIKKPWTEEEDKKLTRLRD